MNSNLQEIIVSILSMTQRGYKPKSLFEKLTAKNKALTNDDIREAIWNLMKAGKIELNSKRKFRLI